MYVLGISCECFYDPMTIQTLEEGTCVGAQPIICIHHFTCKGLFSSFKQLDSHSLLQHIFELTCGIKASKHFTNCKH
jgi:hypothetical protein